MTAAASLCYQTHYAPEGTLLHALHLLNAGVVHHLTLVNHFPQRYSLTHGDEEAAAEILSTSLPGVSRLPRHAIFVFARQSLREAEALVPPPDMPDPVDPVVPVPEAPRPANSNDLLPSVRPRQPTGSSLRKRRRVRAAREEGGIVDDAGSGGAAQSFVMERPFVRLGDVGGVADVLENVRELVEWPLVHRELYTHLGVDPPRGILLHGPSGCGKTLLAHAIAGELGVTFLRVSGPEIVSGMSGESERKLRGLFAEAVRLAPSIIFIDEVDAIASRREGASKDMERRIVSQLLTCIDDLGGISSSAQQLAVSATGNGNKQDSAEVSLSAAPPSTPEASRADLVGTDSRMVDDEDQSPQEQPARPQVASVIIVAATNRPESIEPALRRAGRFDREIELGAPDEDARDAILGKLSRHLTLDGTFDHRLLAKRTAGYVGADLQLLVKEAGIVCVRRFAAMLEPSEDCLMSGECRIVSPGKSTIVKVPKLSKSRPFSQEELTRCAITMDDFLTALDAIQPSALREGFATRPNVSWVDVGALEQVRDELTMAIIAPIRSPEAFTALGLPAPAGVLLYGPPGCGKTLLARAVASESGANFISVKGPELLSKYVGDSELAVRKLFSRARSSAPCVIFFDELDALAPRRGGGGGSSDSSGASERVVNMLLTEMDGFNDRKQVFMIAATNRPDIIDPAMLRPGRLDKLLYVPLPNDTGRVSILRTLLKDVHVAAELDIEAIALNPRCSGFSGADLQALIRTAGETALREQLLGGSMFKPDSELSIRQEHFEHAIATVLPSVSHRDAKLYRSMESSLRKTRAHLSTAGNIEIEDKSGKPNGVPVANGA